MEWIGVIIASGLVGSVLGSILTHWLDGHSDRIKDYYDLADDMHERLSKIAETIHPESRHPTDYDFTRLRRQMTRWQRWRFDPALAAYKTAHHNQAGDIDASGHLQYRDTTEFKKAIQHLLSRIDRS